MESFDKIKALIEASDTIALLPHVNVDGDAFGSCNAFANFLRKMGKSVDVVLEEETHLLKILDADCLVFDGFEKNYDAVFAIDCAGLDRLGKRAVLYKGKTACIDHHKTDGSFGDINHTESDSAATGEIIYCLMKYIDDSLIDTSIAEFIHMAIVSDSGCFKYSNTSERTHRIAGELLRFDGRFSVINRELFDTVSLKKLKIQSEAVNEMKITDDGKIAFYCLSYDRFCELGLSLGDVDFISNILKNIEGVSVGAFLREKEYGLYKVSLRTDESVDASVVAKAFDGGGHDRAAGFSVSGDLSEITERILDKIYSVREDI